MGTFTVKFSFDADDFQAARILDHLFDAYTQLPEIGEWKSHGVVIVPGETFGPNDEQADMEFNNAIDELDSAGIDIAPFD